METVPVESAPVVGQVDAVPVLKTFGYEEVAVMLGVKVQTIYAWVRHGRVPPPLRMGARTRFTWQWVVDLQRDGVNAPGTYTTIESIRAEIGRKGGQARADKVEEREAEARAQLRAVARPDTPREYPHNDWVGALQPSPDPSPVAVAQPVPMRAKKPAAKKPARKKPAAKKPAAKKPATKKGVRK